MPAAFDIKGTITTPTAATMALMYTDFSKTKFIDQHF